MKLISEFELENGKITESVYEINNYAKWVLSFIFDFNMTTVSLMVSFLIN